MANPSVVICTADTWVQVVANVTSATVWKISNAPNIYKQTYRLNLDAAPTDDTDAALLFNNGEVSAQISNDVAIDVYVKAIGVVGSVRVDA